MSNLAVGISIGAVLAGSFDRAVASVPKKLAKIGDALAAVKKRDTKFNLLEGAERNLLWRWRNAQEDSAEALDAEPQLRGLGARIHA